MSPQRRSSPRGPLVLSSLAVATILRAQALPAPAFTISAWTTVNGLPRSVVHGIARDADGYLWLATPAGIARFDGQRFTLAPTGRPATEAEHARALVARPDGSLHVLLAAGPRTPVVRRLADGRVVPVGDETVVYPLRVALDRADRPWLATSTGVRRLVGGAWRPVPAVRDGAVGFIRRLRIDGTDAVWVAGDSGVVRLDGRGAVPIATRCAVVSDVAFERDGTALLATCAGVERLARGARETTLLWPQPLTADASLALTRGDSVLWVADGAAIRRLQRPGRGAFVPGFTEPLDLRGAQVTEVLDDGDGGAFVATEGAGLRHVRRLAARRVTSADGLPVRQVHHLAPDGAGGVLAGSCAGLADWRAGALRPIDTDSLGLVGSCIHGLLRERDGTLWIGQANRLVRVPPRGTPVAIRGIPATPLHTIAPVLVDRRGRLWFGSDHGQLWWVERGSDVARELAPGVLVPGARVHAMLEEADGSLLVGQRGTVVRVRDGRAVTRLGAADGIPPGQVRALVADGHGTTWIATYGGGLARLRGVRDVRRATDAGVPFEHDLSAIALDPNDRLWIFGDAGVFVVDRAYALAAIEQGEPLRAIVQITPDHGVPEGNGGYPNLLHDPRTGAYWFATVDGIAIVRPADVFDAAGAPRARIEALRLDDRATATGDTVVVPAGTGLVELRATAPLLARHPGERLVHRLAGHDPGWITFGESRLARYASLRPGTYAFEVAVTRPGAEPRASATLQLVVRPQWWETTGFRVVVGASAVALAWWGVARYTAHVRRRAATLERALADRDRAERTALEASRHLAHVGRVATAGELATSLAHELTQPLSAIMGTAQVARRLAARGETRDLDETLGLIVAQGERAADVIHGLRAFVSRRQPPDAPVSVGRVVEETVRLLARELRDRDVAVEVVDRRTQPGHVLGSDVQLQQVLVNLLLNAADAMEAQPAGTRRVTVVLADAPGGALRLTVRDTGPGIAPELRDTLFDPFVSSKPSGLGLGLSLSRTIVEAHGGRLWAETPDDGGGVLHLELPVVSA